MKSLLKTRLNWFNWKKWIFGIVIVLVLIIGYNVLFVVRPWIPSGELQALIESASEGSTVELPSGWYREHLVISKSLTLTSADDGTVIIPLRDSHQATIEIRSDDVVEVDLRGVTVQEGSTGISVGGKAIAVLEQVNVRDNTTGIRLSDEARLSIEECVLAHNHFGLDVNDQTNAILIRNDIHNNGLYGIWISDRAMTLISENSFSGHSGQGSAAILVDGERREARDVPIMTISENEFRDNQFGVWISGEANPAIPSNSFHVAGVAGIVVEEQADVIINSNSFEVEDGATAVHCHEFGGRIEGLGNFFGRIRREGTDAAIRDTCRQDLPRGFWQ